MREMGLSARCKRHRAPRTTDSRHDLPLAPKPARARLRRRPAGHGLAGGYLLHSDRGNRQMLTWMRSFGEVQRIGVEFTGSYGAGLLRFLQLAGPTVLEMTTPDNQDRRKRGQER